MEVPVPDSLNWVDVILGICGFALTFLNLIALYANMVQTLQGAPKQMRDSLGNLRQQICEEREALVHQTQQTRASREQDKEKGVVLPLTYSDQTLSLHYMTLKDLWMQFKELERPFLVDSDIRAEAIARGDSWHTDDFEDAIIRKDVEKNGFKAENSADWSTLYRCDFVRRFIWFQTKPDVKRLAEKVVKVMLRRMEREVTQTRLMTMQMRGMEVQGERVYDPLHGVGGGFGEKAKKRKLDESSCSSMQEVQVPRRALTETKDRKERREVTRREHDRRGGWYYTTEHVSDRRDGGLGRYRRRSSSTRGS